jgi:hypothetical protein
MRTHAVTRQSFMDSIQSQVDGLSETIAEGKLNPDRQAEAQAYVDFLKEVPTKYANIDHWKIPFPRYPNLKA